MWTSGEPLPNEPVSDCELDTGRADSLIPPPIFGESVTELVPALVTLWAGPMRPATVWSSSLEGAAEPASGELPAL